MRSTIPSSVPLTTTSGLSGRAEGVLWTDDATGKALALSVTILYTFLAWYLHTPLLEGDEVRYFDDVQNLLNGYFVSDDRPRIYNGPGYPFMLYPFVALGLPVIVLRVLGAVMIGFSAWFYWLAARRVMPARWSVVMVLVCSLHPNLMKQGHMLMTEPLTHLCLAVFLWAFVRTQQESLAWKRWAVLAAAAIWWLTMTRVFMGHVITAMIVGSLIAMAFPRLREVARRTFLIMAGAFVLCTPYLAYTHSKTGSYLLWSTSAGELLYWLTSHEDGENGHWYHDDEAINRPDLAKNHRDFFLSILPLKPLEREAVMKKVAIERVKANPAAFVKNWVCNVSRLFFGFPRSLEREKLSSLVLVMINGTLLSGLAVGLLLAWKRREALGGAETMFLLMTFFYIGGSTLAPALPRYFFGIVPVVVFVALTLLSRVPWNRLWAEEEQN